MMNITENFGDHPAVQQVGDYASESSDEEMNHSQGSYEITNEEFQQQ